MSGGKKCQTSGYWYRMGLHFGICHGPVDAVLGIRVGERDAWSGTQTANGTISINQPNLFGGEEREGGIVGDLDIMMGGQTQTANAYLSAKQGTPQPAYRGILSAVFRGGKIAAMNPYPKPWAFLVRRTLSGWGTAVWYPAKADITLPGGHKAMNPAHIIYECLTNPSWGMGYNPGVIDAASFQAAADVFHGEGLGLCIQWSRQDSIERFIQMVADHAGAVVGQDRRTGLMVIKPIRGGYDVGTLPEFGPHNIIDLAFERAAHAELVNELSVGYVDLSRGGQKSSVTVQNLAAIQAQGGVVAQTVEYPGIPTSDLAARVAARDLRALSTPLARLKITTNRDAWPLIPGDVIRVSWPMLGIENMPVRVLSIDYGSLADGRIAIDAAEDVFGLPATAYTAQQPGLWTPPSTTAVAAPYIETWEASYYDMVTQAGAGISLIDPTACYLLGAAEKPPGLATHYTLLTRTGSAAFVAVDAGDWSPTGVLAAGVGPTDTAITLSDGVRLDAITPGTPAMLGSEVVRIDAIDAGAGTATVSRGCVDTVPTSHAAGTRLWVWHGFGAYDQTDYAIGETVQAKFRTETTTERLSEAASPSDSLVMTGRQNRPYPPGNVRINGQAWPSYIACEATLTWAHRDRITQADQLVPHSTGNIGPEPGVTYTVRWYDESGVLKRTHDGISGTSQVWSTESSDCGGRWQGRITARVESVRSGTASHQYVEVTTKRIGYGLNWGELWGGASGLSCGGMTVSYVYGDSMVSLGASGVTWNPSDKTSGITLTNGDLTAEESTSTYAGVRATTGKSSGKWYWEIRLDLLPAPNDVFVGVALLSAQLTYFPDQMIARGNGQLFATAPGTSVTGSWVSCSAGDIIMFALDIDSGKMWVGSNGSWIGSGNPVTGASPTFTMTIAQTWYPVYRSDNVTNELTRITARFMPADFSYTPPSGYQPL